MSMNNYNSIIAVLEHCGYFMYLVVYPYCTASFVTGASSVLPKDFHRDDKRMINKVKRKKVVETRFHDVKNR